MFHYDRKRLNNKNIDLNEIVGRLTNNKVHIFCSDHGQYYKRYHSCHDEAIFFTSSEFNGSDYLVYLVLYAFDYAAVHHNIHGCYAVLFM